MKRVLVSLVVFFVVCAAIGAQEILDPFAGLEGLPVVADEVVGLDLTLNVNRATQTMVVVQTTAGVTTNVYVVKVTTAVVPGNASQMTNTSQTNTNGSNWTQFPNGTYSLSGTTTMASPYGTAIKTNAKQTLPSAMSTSGSVVDAGYYVHYTPYANTQGCVGVRSQSDMNSVLSSYTATLGTKQTISVY
jgi:hypothetical protein